MWKLNLSNTIRVWGDTHVRVNELNILKKVAAGLHGKQKRIRNKKAAAGLREAVQKRNK